MRILHIVGTISPAAGGPTEVIRMLIRYASTELPPAASARHPRTIPRPRFSASCHFPVHALGSSRKRWFRPALLKWLRKNRSRFDGVIVHGLWEFTGLSALLGAAKFPGYVVFTHGMLDPYFKRAYPAKHTKKWFYWLPAEYWVLRRARRVLFTTDAERDLAAQSFWLHRWKSMVVPIGSEAPPPGTAATSPRSLPRRLPAGRRPGAAFSSFSARINEKKRAATSSSARLGCKLLRCTSRPPSGDGWP